MRIDSDDGDRRRQTETGREAGRDKTGRQRLCRQRQRAASSQRHPLSSPSSARCLTCVCYM